MKEADKTLSRSERKKLRQKYWQMAERQRIKESLRRIWQLQTSKLEDIYVLSRACSKNFIENAIEEWHLTDDLSPKNLAILEQFLSGNIENFIRTQAQKEGRELGYPMYEIKMALYVFIGIYFGDVICKNLGGNWKLPGIISYYVARIFQIPSLFYDRWYIILGNRKRIPVLKIVRLRFDNGQQAKSLYEIYEKIRMTGDWR
jgi:hypothetical protein